MARIRDIVESGSERYLELSKQLDQETKYMMFEPDERVMDIAQQTSQIREMLSRSNSMTLVAEEGHDLVGYLSARGGVYRRIFHKVHIVVGILQAFTRKGIGTALFSELDRWAKASRAHRLELTVMAHNDLALALYKKMGFVIEGTCKDSLFIDGRYVDEYYMAKIL